MGVLVVVVIGMAVTAILMMRIRYQERVSEMEASFIEEHANQALEIDRLNAEIAELKRR